MIKDRYIEGWMNPKNYEKEIKPKPTEATSVIVIIPGEKVTPVDGIPVVVIPTDEYNALRDARWHLRERDAAVAAWDDASARLHKHISTLESEIANIRQQLVKATP